MCKDSQSFASKIGSISIIEILKTIFRVEFLFSADKMGNTRFLPSYYNINRIYGGAVASWLVRSTPERPLRVRALAGDIVLCSWARHFTLTVPLSTQVYKWVPANLMLGVTLRWTSIPSRGEYKYS